MQLTKKDLESIIDQATLNYTNMPIPYYLQGDEVKGHQCVNLSVVMATISFLNSKGLLKEIVSTSFAQWVKNEPE